MDNTMLISLRGAERKLMNDSDQFEKQIRESTNNFQTRKALILLNDTHFHLARIRKQIDELTEKPEPKKTFWQKLFGR